MSNLELKNIIDCSLVSSAQVNSKINDLYLQGFKQVVLKNVLDKKGLLNSLSTGIKVEIIGDVTSSLGNNTSNVKVIVNGDVGENSASCTKSSKFTVLGSCGNEFGNDSESSEFYLLKNCGGHCFSSVVSSKVVIGGIPGNSFLTGAKASLAVILNMKGGTLFLEKDLAYMQDSKDIVLYVRGKVDVLDKALSCNPADESDEDKYLPLISEFARLFKCSLSEIKSLPFYKLTVK
ncbi:MAG: hypothetical protein HYZ79_08920 [Candidatus Melainabacteria bacterium]|nr:hypothetical protein [Candidatus Melainabacteria bacterium]